MNSKFDLIVIGGGPAGYVGAIRAAQFGWTVACIEKFPTLGGTCLNVGCIPSKALLDSSEHYVFTKERLSEHGISVSGIELQLDQMQARRKNVVKKLTQGIDFLFKKNKITRIEGKASFYEAKKDIKKIQVTLSDGKTQILQAPRVLLATGSVPTEMPAFPVDGKKILNSTHALSLEQVPKHLVVIGSGFIGLELGSVWNRLGARVTIVEFQDQILPMMDQELVRKLEPILKKQGMEFFKGKEAQKVEKKGDWLLFTAKDRKTGEQITLECDRVLVAVGRKPHTEGLDLEKVGLKKDSRGRISVQSNLETQVPGIYAVGDVVAGVMLAHKAEEEAIAAIENMAGEQGAVSYDKIPGVLYTHPEFASVGQTEEALKKSNTPYQKGVFPFLANGRALALGETTGWVKVLAHKKTDQILGVHILGPRASDLIAEAVLAMEFGASSEDIARTPHAHPTLPEALKEASLAVMKRAIHS